jgi:hypothetical protein
VLCASDLVSTLCDCSIEVLCASVLVKSGLQNRDYGRRGSAHLPCDTPLSAKVATNLADKHGLSVGIVRRWTQATELVNIKAH